MDRSEKVVISIGNVIRSTPTHGAHTIPTDYSSPDETRACQIARQCPVLVQSEQRHTFTVPGPTAQGMFIHGAALCRTILCYIAGEH